MAESKPTTIPTAISVSILHGEVADFINDNDPTTIQDSYDLIMNCLDKIQSMRAQLRTQHTFLEAELGEDQYKPHATKYKEVNDAISKYVKSANKVIQETNS